MRATPRRLGLVVLILTVLFVIVMGLCLCLGTATISLAKVWGWAIGHPVDDSSAVILGRFRLPRLLLAALVGASLSSCGAVFQSILRNPLADSFILGVSGGAAVGAVLGMSFGISSMWLISGWSFIGALAAVLLVLGIARRRGRMETATLVLTGVMINALFTSIIMFIISVTKDNKLHAILFWLYGDLSGANIHQVYLLAGVNLIGFCILLLFVKPLNLINSGDRAAALAGVNVERVKLILFLTVSLLCGVTVSLSGLIGFIGLMAPHLIRLVLGHDFRLVLPAVMLFGATFLAAADTAARTVISPAQLPVGVVMACLGAPFFLFLLAKRGSRL